MNSLRVNRLPVKAARRTARPDRPFGEGLAIPFVPYFGRQPFTVSDLAWWAVASNIDAPDLSDAEADVLAAESAAFESVTAGCFA